MKRLNLQSQIRRGKGISFTTRERQRTREAFRIRGGAQKECASSPRVPEMLLLWTNKDCKYCQRAVAFLKEARYPYRVQAGGIAGYMRSKEFATLLRNWDVNDAASTPFQASVPVVVATTEGGLIKLVGGYGEMVEYVKSRL